MKILLALAVAVLIFGCNDASKTPKVISTYVKTSVRDSVAAISPDTPKPVYTGIEEAKIKQDSLLRISKMFPFMAKYSFEAYKAPAFKGVSAAPDFNSDPYANDPEYVDFITKGCKQGINFAGHYTIITKSCGAMCSQLFIVDRQNGKIFKETGLKEADGYYGFEYKKDSYLLIANATSLIDASTDESDEFSIKPEIFKWKANSFNRLE
jgi:hypothetical protein